MGDAGSGATVVDCDIQRVWPKIKEKIPVPSRVSTQRFDQYEQEMQRRAKVMPLYNKVKAGYDFETNKRLRINGPQYVRQIRKLQCKLCQRNKRYDVDCLCDWKDVEAVLQLQPKDEYIAETERLLKNIEAHNREVEAYNAEVYNLFFLLASLRKWSSWIIFKGVKYGQEHFHMLHNTNDCGGRLDTVHLRCTCVKCYNNKPCGYRGTEYFICKKCGAQSEPQESFRI